MAALSAEKEPVPPLGSLEGWWVSLAKTSRSPGESAGTERLGLEADGRRVRFTVEQVNTQGIGHRLVYDLEPDGRDHGVALPGFRGTLRLTRASVRALVVEARDGEGLLTRVEREVSKDGNTLTVTRTSADGVTQLTRFTRAS